MKKYDCINIMAELLNYQSYLEIGVRNPEFNMDKVNIPHKEGVDPSPWAGHDRIHLTTSDDYFSRLDPTVKFDAILIDGLHKGEQVYRDIENSIKHLTDHGTIFTHDTNPASEWAQRDEPDGDFWNGTTWKGFVKIRIDMQEKPYHFSVIDTDYGVGLISKGSPVPFEVDYEKSWSINDFPYQWLKDNRKQALNLISIDQYKSEYVKLRTS